ncbi:MAG: hypothetical protein M3Y23_01300, partial [Actinomycetota bacterium]|nr:hypothetical protein [Actinomycetota bacterium]
FALAKVADPVASRDGVLIAFNGGRVNGQPRVKIYAYSYDTNVGTYTEAVLSKSGQLTFPIERLTSDSAVTSLNLQLPGAPIQKFIAVLGQNVTIPAGQNQNYVKARCTGSGFSMNANFQLGSRDSANMDITPTTEYNVATTHPCNGAAGKPKLRSQKVKGPKALKRGQTKVYRVTVRNNGTRVAQGVRIRVLGKWVKVRNQRAGKIAPGASKTYRVRAGLNRKAKRGKKTVIKFRTNAKQTKAVLGKTRVRVR